MKKNNIPPNFLDHEEALLVSKEEALRSLPIDDALEEGPLSGPRPLSRRNARELALKLLYSKELTGDPLSSVLRFFFTTTDQDRYSKFALELCAKVVDYENEIDEHIMFHSEKWDFNRIAIIDKLILRMAITELLYFPDIPAKVTINEAIEIAKRYSTDNSGRFVNGILDAVYNNLKASINKFQPILRARRKRIKAKPKGKR